VGYTGSATCWKVEVEQVVLESQLSKWFYWWSRWSRNRYINIQDSISNLCMVVVEVDNVLFLLELWRRRYWRSGAWSELTATAGSANTGGGGGGGGSTGPAWSAEQAVQVSLS
jgi:hypothetical protein